MAEAEAAPPLLAREDGGAAAEEYRRGGATWAQTLGNVVVSIVGTGVLGLPYAFRAAGWLAGTLGVAAAGCATLYCMLLLVDCRDKLEEEEREEPCDVLYTYGDLGEKCFGTIGRCLTEILIFLSQAGGSVAYLIFIAQNLHSMLTQFMSPDGFIFAVLLPMQIALSFVRSLSSLSPFSIFADACNVLAMTIVIKEDIRLFDHPFADRSAFNGLWAIPFSFGVALFCFEGFSMTLALEASMAERRKFPWVLSQALVCIMFVYACFGVCGYLAYGEATKDIVTLNLPNSWSSSAVKIGLCIALAFTFPVMMHPIHEIIEARMRSSQCFQKFSQNVGGPNWLALHTSRIVVVIILAVVASSVPAFGAFIAFVGTREHGVCSARFRAAYCLPSHHHGVFDKFVVTPAGLRVPSLWPCFCCLWDAHCSLACSLLSSVTLIKIKMVKDYAGVYIV